MNNQQIEQHIQRQRSPFRHRVSPLVSASWLVTLLTGIGLYAQIIPSDFTMVGIIAAAFSFLVSLASSGRELSSHNHNALRDWDNLRHAHIWGDEMAQTTNELANQVRQVYEVDLTGELFPLKQAVRLVDTHLRQRQRLRLVERRLNELRALQKALAEKMAQLQEFGEAYPQGARNLEQIEGDAESLRRVESQIRASCTRLEALVIGVQKVAQSRRIRAELEDLSARVSPSQGALEPAFETESLEDIERQIGREIETYLQLERETEEHLR